MHDLHRDALIEIIRYLSLEDIMRLCQTNRRFADFCTSNIGQRYIMGRRLEAALQNIQSYHKAPIGVEALLPAMGLVSPGLLAEYHRQSQALLTDLLLRQRREANEFFDTAESERFEVKFKRLDEESTEDKYEKLKGIIQRYLQGIRAVPPVPQVRAVIIPHRPVTIPARQVPPQQPNLPRPRPPPPRLADVWPGARQAAAPSTPLSAPPPPRRVVPQLAPPPPPRRVAPQMTPPPPPRRVVPQMTPPPRPVRVAPLLPTPPPPVRAAPPLPLPPPPPVGGPPLTPPSQLPPPPPPLSQK